MKKTIALLSLLVLMLWLVGCNKKTVNINFPFEVGDVETIELYRYAGAPVSAEKKVVDAEETIKDLYDMFEGLRSLVLAAGSNGYRILFHKDLSGMDKSIGRHNSSQQQWNEV